jgi:hypothetical protein
MEAEDLGGLGDAGRQIQQDRGNKNSLCKVLTKQLPLAN